MKLYYFYGTMSSAKSLNLLAKAHQFEQAGSRIMIAKPSLDTRDKGVIRSRVGLERECELIHEYTDIEDLVYNYSLIDALFIDEVQFLTVEQVQQLWRIAKFANVRVFCYGLKTDFKNQLFDASAKLFVMADKTEELVSKCALCDNKATTHIKYGGSSEVNEVGDIKPNNNNNVIYESVCQECYHKHQNSK